MSANAIEVLAQVVEEHGFQATNPMLSILAADALAAVEALLEAAKDTVEMCWRCHAKASPETRSERHGQDWCNVCWDRAQPAPHALAAAVRRVETGQ